MVPVAGRAQPAEIPAGWTRWVSLTVFAALAGIAFASMRPNAVAAGVAALTAVAADALLVWRHRPLLLWATLATAGIVVMSYDESYHVGWFAVCPGRRVVRVRRAAP